MQPCLSNTLNIIWNSDSYRLLYRGRISIFGACQFIVSMSMDPQDFAKFHSQLVEVVGELRLSADHE